MLRARMAKRMHNHVQARECNAACPQYNPEAWRCGRCGRQRAKAEDTEKWAVPLCCVCFDEVLRPSVMG